jgi:acetyltransferase-like isoleucine patch superfamily enzyme
MLSQIYDRLPLSVKTIIRKAIRKSGRSVMACSDVWEPDPRVSIGKYTYGIKRSVIPILTAGTKIDIGKYCSFAPGVVLIVGRHRIEKASTYPFKEFFLAGGKTDDEALPPESITIGNDVWIGSRAMIIASVAIGHGAVVGAGAVVTKDVPPYAVVGGSPARILKMRFNADQIRQMLEIAWWDWPEDRIKANVGLFYGDLDEFIRGNHRHAAEFHPNRIEDLGRPVESPVLA